VSLETTAKEVKAMIAKGDITFNQIRSLIGMQPEEAWYFFREQYDELDGVEITAKEAEQQYGVTRHNLLDWQEKGWVQVLRQGKGGGSIATPTLYNARDVAVMAEMNRAFRRGKGGRIPGWTPPKLIAS
jgi:hypothetical protein